MRQQINIFCSNVEQKFFLNVWSYVQKKKSYFNKVLIYMVENCQGNSLV